MPWRSSKTPSASSPLHLRIKSLPTPTTTTIAKADAYGNAGPPIGTCSISGSLRNGSSVGYEIEAGSPMEEVHPLETSVSMPALAYSVSPTEISAPEPATSFSSGVPYSQTGAEKKGFKSDWKGVLKDFPFPTTISRTGTPFTTVGTVEEWWKNISSSLPGSPRRRWGGLSGDATPKTSGETSPVVGSVGGTLDEVGGKDYLGEDWAECEKKKKKKERLVERQRKKEERKKMKERQKRKKTEAWVGALFSLFIVLYLNDCMASLWFAA